MNQKIEELVSVLDQQKIMLDQLDEVLRAGVNSISTLDIAHLEENQAKASELVEKWGQSAQQCKAVVYFLADRLGIKEEEINISAIIQKLPAKDTDALKASHEKYVVAAGKVDEQVAIQAGLLRESLNAINNSLDLFDRILNPGETYGEGGHFVSRSSGGRFIRQEG